MDCVVEFHNEMRIRIDGLERAVEHIMELVRRLPCTSVDLDDVELALHEALANAVVHGNRQDPRKSVQICGGCERSGETCYWPSQITAMGSTIISFRIPRTETTCFRNMVAAS